MATIKVKQVRSAIGRTKTQKLTLEALGLRKLNQVSRARSYTINFRNGSSSKTFSRSSKIKIILKGLMLSDWH